MMTTSPPQPDVNKEAANPPQADAINKVESPLQIIQVNGKEKAPNPLQADIKEATETPLQANVVEKARTPLKTDVAEDATVPLQDQENVLKEAVIPLAGDKEEATNPLQVDFKEETETPLQANVTEKVGTPMKTGIAEDTTAPLKDDMYKEDVLQDNMDKEEATSSLQTGVTEETGKPLKADTAENTTAPPLQDNMKDTVTPSRAEVMKEVVTAPDDSMEVAIGMSDTVLVEITAKDPQYLLAQEVVQSAQEMKQKTKERHKEAEVALKRAQEVHDEALSEDKISDVKLVQAQQAFNVFDLKIPGQWNSMYNKLVAYKEKYGHCNVSQDKCFGKEKKTAHRRGKPADYDNEDPGFQALARWVGNQRVFYKYFQNGDTKHIKAHRIIALESLGFVWDIKEYRWLEWYNKLKEYKKIHGHCKVESKENKNLHCWVVRQQHEFAKKLENVPYSLSNERIKLLEELDFSFEAPKNSRRNTSLSSEKLWDQKFSELKAFHEKYGHSQVNVRSISTKHNLTEWVAHLRSQYLRLQEGKPSILNAEKIKLLEALDFQWRKPLSLPRKNCGTKKRKGEIREKIRRVSKRVAKQTKKETVADDEKETSEKILL